MSGNDYLRDLVVRGREAINAGPFEKPHLALTILPELVAAVELFYEREERFNQIRSDLVGAVDNFVREVRKAQVQHPETTYRNAFVQQALREVNAVLDRLDMEIAIV